jgi:hypothetical protein
MHIDPGCISGSNSSFKSSRASRSVLEDWVFLDYLLIGVDGNSPSWNIRDKDRSRIRDNGRSLARFRPAEVRLAKTLLFQDRKNSRPTIKEVLPSVVWVVTNPKFVTEKFC